MKPCYDVIIDFESWVRRKPYIADVAKMLNRDTSIISSNCFAGRIMQDLEMKYNSPTLGLYFMYPDYIEFLQHLEFYLKMQKSILLNIPNIRLVMSEEKNGLERNIGIQ